MQEMKQSDHLRQSQASKKRRVEMSRKMRNNDDRYKINTGNVSDLSRTFVAKGASSTTPVPHSKGNLNMTLKSGYNRAWRPSYDTSEISDLIKM